MFTLCGSIAAIWLITYWMLRRAQRREGRIPLDNLPVAFLLIAVLYLTLPPLFWILQGQQYASPLRGRLYAWQPTLDEQSYLTFLGLMVVIGVAASQYFIRGRINRRSYNAPPVTTRVAFVCLALVWFNAAIMGGLYFAGVIRTPVSYAESYQVIQELPLLLRQVVKILGGLSLFAKLVALVWLFQNWRTRKTLAIVVLVFMIATFDAEGGRAVIAIPLFACLILWNRYVRPFRLPELLIVGLACLIGFTALGAARGLTDFRFGDLNISDVGLGEFDVLWGNAIELHREKAAGALRLPKSLWFSEFYGPIPSNILPFEKVGYATWYLDQYYPDYKLEGGGNMFGLMAQLVVGFGWLEALARGFVLGLFLGWLTRYLRDGGKWWCYPVLLYCAVWSFMAVRDSSFSLITPLVQVAVVGVVFLQAMAGYRIARSRFALSRSAVTPG